MKVPGYCHSSYISDPEVFQLNIPTNKRGRSLEPGLDGRVSEVGNVLKYSKRYPEEAVPFSASEAVSSSKLPKVTTPEQFQEMKLQKSGHIWECTRIQRSEVGYIYGFKIREEFILSKSKLKAKKDEIYPAIEPSKVCPFLPDDLNTPRDGENVRDMLFKLGYFTEKTIRGEETLWLPDIGTLQNRLNTLGYKFKICSSEGVACDKEFVEALLEYDSLLSNGKEFVHDHNLHLIPTLTRYFQSVLKTKVHYDYSMMRTRMVEIGRKTITDIEKLNISKKFTEEEIGLAWGALSFWLDALTNRWGDLWSPKLHGFYYKNDGLIKKLKLMQMIERFIKLVKNKFGPEVRAKYESALEDMDVANFLMKIEQVLMSND